MDGFKNTTKTKYSTGGTVGGATLTPVRQQANANVASIRASAQNARNAVDAKRAQLAPIQQQFKADQAAQAAAKANPRVDPMTAYNNKNAAAYAQRQVDNEAARNPNRATASSPTQAAVTAAPGSVALKKGGAVKGAKMPMKKAGGGAVESGNRMSKMDNEDLAAVTRTSKPGSISNSEVRRVRRKVETKAPSAGDSVDSGNRMSRMEGDEARAMGVFKKGGLAAMPKGKC